MKVFLDVDALHKLAGFNALEEALALIGAKQREVWILPTARFKLRLKDPAQAEKRHGPETAARLLAFVKAAKSFDERIRRPTSSVGWA